ncbi:MAG: hypothetical protein GVY29_00490 [Spirochaetes bacterium]|jgi:WD40 repeat protein|nr:hypothetical protein [Spirochaetota bacterium]
MKRGVLLLAFALILGGTGVADVLVNTSHAGAVRDMQITEDGEHLISVGEDGKLKVWDREGRDIRASWQLSMLSLVRLELHPEEPRAAVLEYDGASRVFLSVWDWQTGEPVFRRSLEELPLVMKFSPQGTFLVTSKPTFDSVTILDAETGRERPFVDQGFGIVTYATVSQSERNIMTYTGAGGRIRYFDLSSGRELQSASAVAGLEHLTLLTNRRYALGASATGLVVVDILDGDVEDSYALTNITGIERELDSNQVVVRRVEEGEDTLLRFTADGNNIRRQFTAAVSVGSEATTFTGYGGAMYSASRDGTIHYFRPGGRLRNIFARNVVESVSDVAAGFQSLVAATEERIVRFSSDIFTRPLEQPRYLRYRVTENPTDAAVLLEPAGGRDVLMWRLEDPKARIWSYDPILNQVDIFTDTEAPVRRLSAHQDGILVLSTSGSFSDLSRDNLGTIFSYNALGMEHVILTPRVGILVGKSRTDDFSSALLRIDPETGETVPIRTDERLIFDMAYDGEGDLYTLGLRNRGGDTETVLRRRSGRNFMASDSSLTAAGEHLNGHVIYDERSESAFAIVDQPTPYRIRRRNQSVVETAQHRASRIAVVENTLVAANTDGSISFWSVEAGNHLGDLYLFRGGDWALLTADGRYAAPSRFDESYLRYVPSSRRDRRDLQDRKIDLPLR